jgi:plasmid replication initiation protein
MSFCNTIHFYLSRNGMSRIFRVQGSGFKVQGSRFKVEGSRAQGGRHRAISSIWIESAQSDFMRAGS